MKQKHQQVISEGEALLQAIRHVEMQMECARSAFSSVTDENLIESYIYEIIALQKKYAYFLKLAKETGLRAGYAAETEKIS